MMRSYKHTLYMDAMPGRSKAGRPTGNFRAWLQQMKDNDITTVVCLAPDADIAAESPQYAAWRAKQKSAGASAGYKRIDVPIPDYSIPGPTDVARFWTTAADVAKRIEAGERIFVHCGAGIGRTGMFLVAVLMQQGMSYEDAYAEIAAVGSHPETAQQVAFLKRGAS